MFKNVNILKVVGFIASGVLVVLALFLAHTPWRVHGGRFITEYLALGGAVAIVALVVLAITLRWG
jgi:hypothetical protein